MKNTGQHSVYGKGHSYTTISVCWLGVLVARGPQWDRFQRLSHHVCFTSSDVQLKEAIPFTYGDSLTTGDTTGAGREVVNVLKTHQQEVNIVEREEGGDVQEMRNSLIYSEIPE